MRMSICEFVHWININISTSALNLNHFLSNKTYACIDLFHTRQKKNAHVHKKL